MKAVIVDDEYETLEELKELLIENGIELSGAFTNPLDALESVEEHNPDCAFLDIEMPGVNGLELAERLLERMPHVQIVFITAFNHYATQAFEVNAIDYVLKPIHPTRFAKTVERLTEKHQQGQEQRAGGENVSIQTLGDFAVLLDAQPVKWSRSKAKELLAYLLHCNGQKKHKYEICELLWPNQDPKKALVNLQTAIYALRKNLGAISPDVLRLAYADDCYSLTLGRVHWDAGEFEQQYKALLANSDRTALEKAAWLYRGDYMGNQDWPWSQFAQVSLSQKYEDVLKRLVESCYKEERFGSSIEWCMKLLDRQPIKEAQLLLLQSAYAAGGLGEMRRWAERLERLCVEVYDTNLDPAASAYYHAMR
ncbi:response regulator [Cohnella silvisoli]|uniref:Response regulator n=1 Tax=Cohnella silvisoli TaxID=2873699 RepID=A0ABV1KQQ9_9BACL|nr:response regulator [Cohnella silvisoli]MCD9024633.1 response regulator [Cohnella silvisoli]